MYSPYERLYYLLAYVPGDHTTYFDRARRVIPLIWPYSRLFHLSNRVPGLYTLVWPKRDLFPLANVYSVYIDPLPISTTYYTQDTYSFFLDKFQIFPGFSPPVCVPPPPYRHTANKKGNINVTCATCIDPSMHIGGCESCTRFERKPIHFYFEKRTISFTVNTKKRKRTEVVRDVDYFLRDTKICSQTWHYCRGIMIGKISRIFFFFFLLILLYTFINPKKKKGYYFYVFLIIMEATCVVETKKNEIKKCFLYIWQMKNIFLFFYVPGRTYNTLSRYKAALIVDVHCETHKCLCNFTQRCHNPIVHILLLIRDLYETCTRSKCSTNGTTLFRKVSRIDNRFEYFLQMYTVL